MRDYGLDNGFILKILPIIKINKDPILPTEFCLAVACLESSFGSNFLALQANNFFGQKWHNKHGLLGEDYIIHTSPENNMLEPKESKFKIYSNFTASFIDFNDKFVKDDNYIDAYKMMLKMDYTLAQFWEVLLEINKKYSTLNPGWAFKVYSLMYRINNFLK